VKTIKCGSFLRVTAIFWWDQCKWIHCRCSCSV